MIKTALSLGFVCSLALAAGPIAILVSQAGQKDPNDLYFVLDYRVAPHFENDLLNLGASQVGPVRGAFAEMVHAPPSVQENLLTLGYILLPAGSLAALCGTNTDQTQSITRDS